MLAVSCVTFKSGADCENRCGSGGVKYVTKVDSVTDSDGAGRYNILSRTGKWEKLVTF